MGDHQLAEYVGWGIYIVAALGLCYQISAWNEYSTELRHIEKLKKKLKSLLVMRASGDDVMLGADKLLAQESVPEESMTGTRTKEIQIFSKYPGMVALHDLGAVAVETDAGRFRNAFPNVLIASLLVCGLLGTLWSLSETLQSEELTSFIKKEGVASASDFQAALAPVVDGFGEAFKASIAGVLSTVVLIFVRMGVRVRRESCFGALEYMVLEGLLPYFIEPEQDVLRRASSLLDHGSSKYSQAVLDLESATSKVSESVEAQKEATEEAAAAFGEHGTIAYQLTLFTQQTAALSKAASTISSSGEKTRESLEELTAENKKLHQEVIKHNADMGEKQAELVSELQGSVEALSHQLKKYPDSVAEMLALKDSMMKEVRETVSKQTGDFKKVIGSLKDGIDQYPAELKAGVEELERSYEKSYAELRKGGEAQAQALGENANVFSKQIGESMTQLEAGLAKLPDLVQGAISVQIGSVKDAIESMSSANRNHAEKFAELSGSTQDATAALRQVALRLSAGSNSESTKKRRRWFLFFRREK